MLSRNFPELSRPQAHALELMASYASSEVFSAVESAKWALAKVDVGTQAYADRKGELDRLLRDQREIEAIYVQANTRRAQRLDAAERDMLEAVREACPEISGADIDALLCGRKTIDDLVVSLAPDPRADRVAA